MDLLKSSLSQIGQSVRQKKISAAEVAQFFLERCRQHNAKLNAFLELNEKVVEEARALDQRISRGEDPGVLAGVPVGVKDMFCTRGIKTTAGSRILQNFVPPYDATVVHRLKKQGALVLGKTNQDEFAMGSSNENSAFGNVRNPWNLDFVPGGSSGGSAAAVAAGLTPLALGTDTGGSIRQPSHFCSLVGLKPTYGRVSRYGIISYASSLDQAGPMVHSVADAALALEVMAGHDPKDATTAQVSSASFVQNLSPAVKGMKIGLLKEFMRSELLDGDVAKTLNQGIELLRKAGAEIVEVSVPLTQYAVPVYYLVATSEASSNLAKYDGVKFGHRSHFESLAHLDLGEFYQKTRSEGFGKEVKRRILLGTYCLSSGYYDAFYKKACQVRRLIQQEFLQAFAKCDVILSPVSTSPAFLLGDRIKDPLTMYLNDIFTVSTNLSGFPGMSVPAGFSQEGLPIGLQLQAPHFEEQKILNVGLLMEQSFQISARRPNAFA